MGKKHGTALLAEGLRRERLAAKTAQGEHARIQDAEAQRSYMEQNLGTEAQLEGTLTDLNPAEADYTGRWQVNEAVHTSTKGKTKIPPWLQEQASQANALMEQAQAAAKAGNVQEAARLKAQAEGFFGNEQRGARAGAIAKGINFVNPAAPRAAAQMGDPQAMIVGSELRRARQMQDWDSQTSQEFRGRLGEGAHRALDVAGRENARQSLIGARRGGAATNSAAERLLQQRSSERLAAGHAQIEAEVASSFENFRTQYAKDSVGFAQAWLDSKSGIRGDYLQMVANAGLASAQAQSNAGGTLAGEGNSQRAAAGAKVAARRALAVKGAAVLASVVTAGAGAAFAGATLAGTMAAGLNAGAGALGGSPQPAPSAPPPKTEKPSYFSSLFGNQE